MHTIRDKIQYLTPFTNEAKCVLSLVKATIKKPVAFTVLFTKRIFYYLRKSHSAKVKEGATTINMMTHGITAYCKTTFSIIG
jgi:hypothetical protein